MSWFLIAIIAYALLAIVNIGDKLFLGNFVPNYKAYTALIGILGIVLFVAAPWFLVWPGVAVFIVSIFAGVLFAAALLSFFYSLQVGQASRVIPFVGGLVPVFSLMFAAVFIGETLSVTQLVAFFFLIVGTTILIRIPHKTHWWEEIWKRIHKEHHTKEMLIAVLAAALFAGSFVASKYVYTQTEFLSGFMWIRLGTFIAGLAILTSKDTRKAFVKTFKKLPSSTGALFVGNQAIGAGGFLLQNYAISLGTVALVNALQGVQYIFVIALAILASIFFPKLAGKEDVDPWTIIEKIFAVIVIGGGLWVLAFV